jgi:hypothetical protein
MSSTTIHSLPPPFAMDPVQDWAYAASRERPRTLTCTPETYGGYDGSKTSYSVGTNRALSFTVSSRSKSAPTRRRLDRVRNVFHAKDDSKGLKISRNIRLILVATDLVQPYVSIFGINNAISDDIIPSSYHQPGNMCDTTGIVAVPGALSTAQLEQTNKSFMEIRLLTSTSAITKMNQRCMKVRLLMLTSTITEINQRCIFDLGDRLVLIASAIWHSYRTWFRFDCKK